MQIPQLTRIAIQIGLSLKFFKRPYQAKVMKTFDKVSKKIVLNMQMTPTLPAKNTVPTSNHF